MSTGNSTKLSTEEKKILEQTLQQTTAFIKTTNDATMIGLRDTILDAILALETPDPATTKLLKDPSTGTFYYSKKDVLEAITRGYDTYKMLVEMSMPKSSESERLEKVLEEGMNTAGLSEEAINKEIKEIKGLQEETKEKVEEIVSQPYSYIPEGNEYWGGMYRPREHKKGSKKSRKHPK